MFTSNLISDKLSYELSNKFWKKAPLNLYVSTNGSDDAGNGTEQKPFASLTKALTYIKDNLILKGQGGLNVKFLTDYSYSGSLYIFGQAGNTGQGFINIDGNGHKVTLATGLNIYNSHVSFTDIDFETNANSTNVILISWKSAVRFLGTINFTVKHDDKVLIYCSYFSKFENASNINVTVEDNKSIGRFVRVQRSAFVDLSYIDDKTISLNCSCSFAFFDVFSRGYVQAITNKFTGESKGQKYYCNTGGTISINGKGEDFLPGDEAGVIQPNKACWVG